MDYGRQNLLVAHYDGGAFSCLDALWSKPLADVSRLDIFGGGGEESDILLLSEVGVDVFASQLVRESMEIGGDVLSCFVAVVHIVGVIIPVEDGFFLPCKFFKEALLHFL